MSGPIENLTVAAPTGGQLLELRVEAGDSVTADQLIALIEVMKMETEVRAPRAGTVLGLHAALGATLGAGDPILELGPIAATEPDPGSAETVDDDSPPRSDLAELYERRERSSDAGRAEAVARHHGRGRRTARENVADLVDPGSFSEYGRFALAAQRARRSEDELIDTTPGDGVVGGTATVNAGEFGEGAARCAVVSYDYTVLAGTQGHFGHLKKDRLFELIERIRVPVILFAEGGGGRPGDTDMPVGSMLTARAFALWSRLSGKVPRIAIVAGRCFAGNAALAGCSDLIIATEDSNLGMGGPAMVAGGGLGDFAPEQIGPIDTQEANGVIDIRVADEAEAVAVAKQLVGYFQGRSGSAKRVAADQDLLRELVPESRRRSYEVRDVLETLCDTGSVLELRRGFGAGMVTALARIDGRPIGIIANDQAHLAGAITSEGADKAARFLQLCEAFGLPVLSVVDTPGMMVGPEVEETALVRHCSRLFNVGCNLTVPLFALVIGRGYGLGAQAMVGGSFLEPLLTLAWPSGELGPMGIEGAVRLGMRKELEAINDESEREQRVRDLSAGLKHHFRALNVATYFELDDVIDPTETRSRLSAGILAAGETSRRELPWLDAW